MAFYIKELANGTKLPAIDKVGFLLKYLPESNLIAFEKGGSSNFPDFQKDLVCVVENVGHDAACYVDIPRQWEICSAKNESDKYWLVIPGVCQKCKIYNGEKLAIFNEDGRFWGYKE